MCEVKKRATNLSRRLGSVYMAICDKRKTLPLCQARHVATSSKESNKYSCAQPLYMSVPPACQTQMKPATMVPIVEM